MDPVDLFPYASGIGGALFVLLIGHFLWITGKIVTGRQRDKELATQKDIYEGIVDDKNQQIALLNTALSRERDRQEAGTLAAQTAATVLQAIHREIER